MHAMRVHCEGLALFSARMDKLFKQGLDTTFVFAAPGFTFQRRIQQCSSQYLYMASHFGKLKSAQRHIPNHCKSHTGIIAMPTHAFESSGAPMRNAWASSVRSHPCMQCRRKAHLWR